MNRGKYFISVVIPCVAGIAIGVSWKPPTIERIARLPVIKPGANAPAAHSTPTLAPIPLDAIAVEPDPTRGLASYAERLERLDIAAFRDEFAELRTISPPGRRAEWTRLLVRRWALRDPRAALAALESYFPDGAECFDIVLAEWINESPSNAWKWASETKNRKDAVGARYHQRMQNLFERLLWTRRFEVAAGLIAATPDMEYLSPRLASSWARTDMTGAARWSTSLPSPGARADALGSLLNEAARFESLDAASALIDILEHPDEIRAVIKGVVDSGNEMPGLADWLTQVTRRMPTEMADDVLRHALGSGDLRNLSDADVEALFLAINSTERRLAGAILYVASDKRTQGASASKIAAAFVHGANRDRILAKALSAWAENDRESARAFVESSPHLTAAERTHHEQAFNKPSRQPPPAAR